MRPTVIFSLLALALLGLVVYAGMTRPASAPPITPTSAAQPMPTVPPIFLTGAPPSETPAQTAVSASAVAPMALPPNYRADFDLYAIVDRADNVTRRLYISPAGVDALRAGQAFPDGTQIVIEAYDARLDASGQPIRDASGHLVAGAFQPEVHMSELRADWPPADLIPNAHTGGVNFDAFDFSSGKENPSARASCFNCHQSAFQSGYVYSLNLIELYALSGQTQYSYCALPDRLPCPQ